VNVGHLISLTAECRWIRRSLRVVDRSLRRLVPPLAAAMRNGAQAEKPRRLSAKARASLVLQGRYMEFMPRAHFPRLRTGTWRTYMEGANG
jgi:hypothetical protein